MPKRCIGVGSAEKSAEKGFPFRGNASEKKCASVPEVLPRMSISERKPVAGALQSRVPRPASVARKGLDFNYRPNMKGLKVKSSHFAKHDSHFNERVFTVKSITCNAFSNAKFVFLQAKAVSLSNPAVEDR